MPITGYVINLDKRTDRWNEILKEFSSLSSIKPERFSAYSGSPGWKYCTLSHQELVRRARSRGDPLVLVIEDDVAIKNKEYFDVRFYSILKWLSENTDKWEVFNGGPCFWMDHQGPTEVLNRELGLVRLNWGATAHFVIYSSKIYDKIINLDPREDSSIIDVFISTYINQVTTAPYLAYQRPNYSNLEGRFVDFTSYFDKFEKKCLDLLINENNLYILPRGGFGNILFGILIGYSLAKKYNKLLIFISKYQDKRRSITSYELFNQLNYSNSPCRFCESITEKEFIYSPITLPLKKPYILDGYFQSYKYSHEYINEIKEYLFSKNPQLLNKCKAYLAEVSQGETTIMLHVRRGDYLSISEVHPILSDHYYETALQQCPPGKILAFSDDVSFLKTWPVLKNRQHVIVDIPQENIEQTFICMSLCDHFILANSSFSLISYYFRHNKNSRLFMPKNWFGPSGPHYKLEDLVEINENVKII